MATTMSPERPLLCTTKEGHQAVIVAKKDGFLATIIDRSIPRCLQLVQLPVVFAAPLTIANIRQRNRLWQQRHVQLARYNNAKVLLVGKLVGLLGGGNNPSSSSSTAAYHDCRFSSCEPYQCDRCGYACRNRVCIEQCMHRFDHQCEIRQGTQCVEQENRQHVGSTSMFYLGLQNEQEDRQESQQQALQNEREHQERMTRRLERVRLLREREAGEQERVHDAQKERKQEERQEHQGRVTSRIERVKLLREREAGVQKQQTAVLQEKREHQEQISCDPSPLMHVRQKQAARGLVQLERERLQRKIDKERNENANGKQLVQELRQARIKRKQNERERKEKEDIFRKFDTASFEDIDAQYVSVSDELVQELRQDRIKRKQDEQERINKEDIFSKYDNAFLAMNSFEDIDAQYGSVSDDEDVETQEESNYTEVNVIQQTGPIEYMGKGFERDVALEPIRSQFEAITIDDTAEDKSTLIDCVLKRLKRNMSVDGDQGVNSRLRIRRRRELTSKQKLRDQLQREVDALLIRQNIRARAFKQLSKDVRLKLSNASVELVLAILEHVQRGGKLQNQVVKRLPVNRWIEQSLILELVTYPVETFVGTVLLEVFKEHWLVVNDFFEEQQRLSLLYSLRAKQLEHELRLDQINDMLRLVGILQSKGIEIVCSEENFSYRKLKRLWVEARVGCMDSDSKIFKSVVDTLVEIPWNSLMLEQFLVHTERVNSQSAIRDLLTIIVNENLAYPIVMNVLNAQPLEKSDCVQIWIQELKYHLLIDKVSQTSPSIARMMNEKLGILLRTTSCDLSLAYFIKENVLLLEQNLQSFIGAVEQICTFQIPPIEWNNVLVTLKNEKIPMKWAENIDQLIISNTFGDRNEYSFEDLIKQINLSASDVQYVQEENLRSAYNAVDKAYSSKSQSFSSNPAELSCSINNSSCITITNDLALMKITQKPICDWKETEVNLWANFVKANPSLPSQEEVIAVLKRSVELCNGFSPRVVQLLSLLVLANPARNHGRLAQINTGEGKSIIVAMLAALHALRGTQVDVVTTSTELSIPEVRKQRPFFKLLHLTVDENSSERDKKSVYSCDIVYGTASDFQGDILRTEFLGNDVRGDRKHQVIIVDEVDSMLFDCRTHSVRLGNECPGMNHLEAPLAVIWGYIHYLNQQMISVHGVVYFIPEDFDVLPDQKIHLCSGGNWKEVATVVEDKYKFITERTEERLSLLLRLLTDAEKEEYKAYRSLSWEISCKQEELSNVHEENKGTLKEELENLNEKFNQLPWRDRISILDIPEHLRLFALTQLPIWIKNAILAEWTYKKNAHYTVVNKKIVPINYNETGDLQMNMIWSDGLAQFLQIKEGLRVDPEGISTNFISNVSFFQRYGSNIYGLTGTLGENSTRKFLHEMYDTDMVVIPPHNHVEIRSNSTSNYRCKELASLVCSSLESWYSSIVQNALYHTRNQRAVLVICKFISQVTKLSGQLHDVYYSGKIFTYTGETDFQKQTIDSGEIVLATNIAGRGTDFKTSQNVEKHGGMCVLLTFLPESFRVEMQNVGRTARGGKRGMAQLIVFEPGTASAETLKKLRHAQEDEATAKASDDARKMLIQDALFRQFCQLENAILPSHDETKTAQRWKWLMEAWKQFSYVKTDPEKVAEKAAAWLKETTKRCHAMALGQLTVEEQSKLNKDDIRRLKENATKQMAADTRDFNKRYQQNVKKAFISKNSKTIPPDLLERFRNGQTPAVKHRELAERFGWTNHERKGAEESFGLWLKGNRFDNTDITLEDAMALFKSEFETTFQSRARDDKLIQNPFFYVLKGNDMLDVRNVSKAIFCYNRAIELDPVFSVNAHYNMAQALLSYPENKGEKQEKALEQLKDAKRLIRTVFYEHLLFFNMVTAQQCTSQHAQHQLNVLSRQEGFIDGACKVISNAQKNGNNVKLKLKTLAETFCEAQEDHGQAIREAEANGLKKLFIVEEKVPPPWKQFLAVLLFGIAQITAGCLVMACGGGMLGLLAVAHGVYEMVHAVYLAINGKFSHDNYLAIDKVVTIYTFMFFSEVKKILKIGLKILRTQPKNKARVEEVGEIINGTLKNGTITDSLSESRKHRAYQTFVEDLENEITAIIGDVLTKAVSSNPLVLKCLEADECRQSSYWKQKFIEHGKTLLTGDEFNKCIQALNKLTASVSSDTNSIEKTMTTEYTNKCINEIRSYLTKFINNFNGYVASYKEHVNKADRSHNIQPSVSLGSNYRYNTLQRAPEVYCDGAEIGVHNLDTDASYSTLDAQVQICPELREPSTPKALADELKRMIVARLFTSTHNEFVDPLATRDTSHVTNGLFRDQQEAFRRLREKIMAERGPQSDLNKPESSNEKSIEKEPHVQKLISQIDSKDYAHDMTCLALSSTAVQLPVHVYDDNDNLIYEVGREFPRKPITLKYNSPSDEHPLGQFSALDSKIWLIHCGRTLRTLEIIVAQLTPAQQETLQVKSAAHLRDRIIEQILANPQQTKEMYDKQVRLRQILPNYVDFARKTSNTCTLGGSVR